MKKMIALVIVLALCLSIAPMAMAADDTYTVAGSVALTGYNWDTSKNEMTLSGSVYTITFYDVPAGSYEFKVVKNANWDTCWPSSNYALNTEEAGDVTITFNPADNSITVDAEGAPSGDYYIVAGDTGLTGSNWAQGNMDNKMAKEGNLYTITFEDVVPGTYGFKVVKNADWDQAWPSANYVVEVSAVSDVKITYNPADNAVNATVTPTGSQVVIVNKYIVAGSPGLCGSEWDQADENNKLVEDNGIYTITYEDVPAGYYEFKIVKNESWSSCWPSDNYELNLENTSNVTITFDPSDNSIDVQIVAGGVVVPDKYVVAGDKALTGANWDAASTSNEMTESNGVYTITYEDVPAGSYKFKVVKNGSTWIPDGTDNDQVVYTIAAGDVTITYNPATGTISVVAEGAPTDDRYVVAGDEALCGSNWNGSDEANEMTENDGVYTITYADVPAGTYKFKVVKNGTTWIPDGTDNDQLIYTVAAGDVTITYDPTTGTISVVAEGAPTEDRYVVAGSEGLCGTPWSATDEDNLMSETSEGVYAITYTAVAAGEYELKVVLNGTNWIGGADGNNVYITVSEACDVTVTYSAASGIQVTGTNVTVGAPTNTPTTGDSTNLIAVIAVMILSGALLVTTVSSKKRFF